MVQCDLQCSRGAVNDFVQHRPAREVFVSCLKKIPTALCRLICLYGPCGTWIDRSSCKQGAASTPPGTYPPRRGCRTHTSGRGRLFGSPSPTRALGASGGPGRATVPGAAVASQAATAEPIPSKHPIIQGWVSLQQRDLKRPRLAAGIRQKRRSFQRAPTQRRNKPG